MFVGLNIKHAGQRFAIGYFPVQGYFNRLTEAMHNPK